MFGGYGEGIGFAVIAADRDYQRLFCLADMPCGDFLPAWLAGFLVPGGNFIANLNVFYGSQALFCRNQRIAIKGIKQP